MATSKFHAIVWVGLAIMVPSGSAGQFSAAERSSVEAGAVLLRDRALTDSLAYELVGELTTRFGPRLAGSEAERAAAEWMAKKFQSLGFSNVRVETFPISVWQRNAERVDVVSPFSQRLAAAALGGSPSTGPGGIQGEVVIFETLEALSESGPGALAGKIAMLNYRMPKMQSGNAYNVATAGRGQGPGEAARHGAIGFIMRSAGTDEERSPHAGSTRYVNGRVPIPAFAISAIDANQIERLAAFGAVTVRLQSGASIKAGQSQNVIAEIRGREEPETIVLIGAHLDSWDLGTGAVDDAAGVGIVTAAAKLIRDMPRPPRRTIRIVLFGAEEQSQPAEPFFIYGAHAYATNYQDQISRHLIASEADLGAGRIYGIDLPEEFAFTDFGRQVGRILLPLGILLEPEVPPHGGADILPLQAAGVPVFLMKQDASLYFDLHHTDRDTFDKISKAELDQNVAAWAALLWLIADGHVDFRKPADQAADRASAEGR